MSSQPSKKELQILLDVATEAALTAGAILQDYRGKLATLETSIEEKGRPGDLVTIADKTAEAAILEVMERHVPDHAILAEESGQYGDRDHPYQWAIDPLDGTTNYAHQYPFYAVSIGLLIEGKSTVGVVYDPSHDELFRAAKGLGATCNRRPIQVSKTQHLKDSLLVTGFAYDRRETSDNNYAEFCHLTHLTHGVRRSGSASIDLTHVARGCLDGYWERGLSPWDLAAGVILVEEAGGNVTAYDGSPFDIKSGRLLATNGHLHSVVSKTLGTIQPLDEFKIENC